MTSRPDGTRARLPPVSAFVDTSILVRHLTGDAHDGPERATAFLAAEPELYLADLVLAETVDVLDVGHDVVRTAWLVRVLPAMSLCGREPTGAGRGVGECGRSRRRARSDR